MKLDFQKAYNCVRWSFINCVLKIMGFGEKWRVWTKSCLSSASMSILVSGSTSKPFKMERGLRQGNPLSLFLFVLVADVLDKLITKAMDISRIKPLKVGKMKVDFSHIQFTDDTAPKKKNLLEIIGGC